MIFIINLETYTSGWCFVSAGLRFDAMEPVVELSVLSAEHNNISIYTHKYMQREPVFAGVRTRVPERLSDALRLRVGEVSIGDL